MNIKEPEISKLVRGTRILIGSEKRLTIEKCINEVEKYKNFTEIILPILDYQDVYIEKAGEEILNQMYIFNDKSDRKLCLRPEGTVTCQLLADEVFKHDRDVYLWYVTNCYRYERPQKGRYREFTQFGVEILNPKIDDFRWVINLAEDIIKNFTDNYDLNLSVKRGLSYYTEDGFEISCPELGSQKQVCGGGRYKQGYGFAFGIDRLMILNEVKKENDTNKGK